MTLNKFCPVAQGEYYNNKFPRKSQHFFPVFLKFFLLFVQLQHIAVHNCFAYNICNSVSSHHLSNFKLLFYTIKTGIALDVRFLRLPQDAGMFRRVEEEAAVFRRENARGFAPDKEDAPYTHQEAHAEQ